jgi:ribosome-associated protein
MTSRQLVRLVREAAEAKKAREVIEIDLRKRSTMADFFVICEGDTDRQTRAIADAIRDALEARGVEPFHTHGEREGTWILLDFIDVIVHVFLPGEREYYDLESLWTEPAMVELGRKRAAAGAGTASRARRTST